MEVGQENPQVKIYKANTTAYFREVHPEIAEIDLEEFFKATLLYVPKKPDLHSDVYLAIETVKVQNGSSGARSGKRPSKDKYQDIKIFINQVKQTLKRDVLDKLTLYVEQDELSECEAVEASPKGSTKGQKTSSQSTPKRNYSKSVYDGNTPTYLVKLLLDQYSKRTEKGSVIHTNNKHLDFSRSRKVMGLPGTTKPIGNFQPKNFLNIKAQDFADSFKFRLSLMECEFSRILADPEPYTRPNSQVQAFNDPKWIVARILLDDDQDLQIDRIKIEFLTSDSQTRTSFVSANGLNDYIFYPNMITALQVVGDIYDSSCPMQVKRQLELDEKRETYSTNLTPSSSSPESALTILVFKGPFTVKGESYFPGFDLVLHHITQSSPDYVVLIGPFASADQVNPEKPSPLDQSDGYDIVRQQNFQRLIRAIPRKMDVELIIAQDINEVDNFFPLPVPFKMNNIQEINGVKITRVGTPAILNLGSKLNLAISGDDTISNLFSMPVKTTVPKYERIMKSIVSQKCMCPAFPTKVPFDVTQIKLLNFGISTQTALEFRWKEKDKEAEVSAPTKKSSSTAIIIEDEPTPVKPSVGLSRKDPNSSASAALGSSIPFAPLPDVWIIPSILPTFVMEARGVLACNPKTILINSLQDKIDFGTFAKISVDANIASTYSKNIKIEVLNV